MHIIHIMMAIFVLGRKKKSVFSFLRQLITWHCPHLLLNAVLLRRPAAAAVDRYLLPAGPTAANPPYAAAAVDRWDRQTDTRTETDRQTDVRRTVTQTLPHTMRAVSIMDQLSRNSRECWGPTYYRNRLMPGRLISSVTRILDTRGKSY